jgi:hypothetical protein
MLAAEAKFTEKGFEPCSCPSEGSCTDVIHGRKYWAAATQLGWDHRSTGGRCLVRTAYQPIRNLAAAMALAPPGVLPCFALFYDERNPYFAGTGSWPGWAWIIESASQRAADEIVFAPVSWQRLLACAPLHDSVVEWAEEKHGLRAEDRYIQPQMCGYDGDGDIWIELSDRVPNEAAALDAAARLDGGTDEWSVVGRDSLRRECNEWVGCDPEAPDAKLFWHVQWADGPVEA